MQTLLAAIFVFGLLIFVHEFGHYIAAKKSGVKVLELAIGFGPKILGWQKNDTDYSLRIIPLGGFCRMLGEDPEEKDLPGSFTQKSVLTRMIVIAAGPVMNIVLTVVLFFSVYFFFVGIPAEESTRIGHVEPNQPADEAGLEVGDEIVAIDGEEVTVWEDVLKGIEGKAGEEITISFLRNGEEKQLEVTPELEEHTGQGLIHVGPETNLYSLGGSLEMSFNYIAVFFSTLYQVIAGEAPADVTGPAGIIAIVGEAAAMGFVNLLMLTALISINIALVNLLPIPALDGGRLLFLIIEGFRGKPLDPEKEGFIHFIGFALLITLILVITYHDIMRWDFF